MKGFKVGMLMLGLLALARSAYSNMGAEYIDFAHLDDRPYSTIATEDGSVISVGYALGSTSQIREVLWQPKTSFMASWILLSEMAVNSFFPMPIRRAMWGTPPYSSLMMARS